jgi:hypothetical protein
LSLPPILSSTSANPLKRQRVDADAHETSDITAMGDTLGHEVHKCFGDDDCLCTAMMSILEHMSPEEREVMCAADDNDGKGNFDGKMEELLGLCQAKALF